MKQFEEPILKLQVIEVEDLITTSGCEDDCPVFVPDPCDWET